MKGNKYVRAAKAVAGGIAYHAAQSAYTTAKNHAGRVAAGVVKSGIKRMRATNGCYVVGKKAKVPVAGRSGGGGGGRNSSATVGGRMKLRPVRNTRARKIGHKGLMFQKKTGGTTDTQEQLFIGHSTCAVDVMQSHVWRTLFKEVMTRAQVDITDTTVAMPELTASCVLIMYYQRAPGDTLHEEHFDFLGNDKIEDLVAWAAGGARPWNFSTTDETQQIVFHAVRYISDAADSPSVACYLPLKGARVSWCVSSELKMQNRTIDRTGENEITDIDNVPLYAEGFGGSGTGAVYNLKPTLTGSVPVFIADGRDALIALAPGVDYKAPKFIPDASQFDGVSRAGKFDILPGQIRNSKLSYNGSMLFNKFFNVTNPNGIVSDHFMYKKLGKFVFFGIQKKLHYAASDTNIQCVYELEYKMSASIRFGRVGVSCTTYVEEFDTNIVSAPVLP